MIPPWVDVFLSFALPPSALRPVADSKGFTETGRALAHWVPLTKMYQSMALADPTFHPRCPRQAGGVQQVAPPCLAGL